MMVGVAVFGVDRAYVSEFALWMNGELASHAEWREEARMGKRLWWSKKPDSEAESGFVEASVRLKSYPYDVNFSQSE